MRYWFRCACYYCYLNVLSLEFNRFRSVTHFVYSFGFGAVLSLPLFGLLPKMAGNSPQRVQQCVR